MYPRDQLQQSPNDALFWVPRKQEPIRYPGKSLLTQLKMLSSGADTLLREKAAVWHEHGQQILAQSHHTKIEFTENEENLLSYKN